jgi:hypothetical protein
MPLPGDPPLRAWFFDLAPRKYGVPATAGDAGGVAEVVNPEGNSALLHQCIQAAIPGKPQLCRTGTEEGLRAALKNFGLTEKAVDDTVRHVNETGTSAVQL